MERRLDSYIVVKVRDIDDSIHRCGSLPEEYRDGVRLVGAVSSDKGWQVRVINVKRDGTCGHPLPGYIIEQIFLFVKRGMTRVLFVWKVDSSTTPI
jgi:hypothetical protein